MIDINTLYSIIFNATKTLTCPTTNLKGIAPQPNSCQFYALNDQAIHKDMIKFTFDIALSDLDQGEVITLIADALTNALNDTHLTLKTIHLDCPSRLTYNARTEKVRSSKGEQTLTIHILMN